MQDMSTSTDTEIWTRSQAIAFVIILSLFFVVATVIGTGAYLANPNQSVIVPIGITAAIPVVLFLLAYAAIERFRAFVLAQDLRLITQLQLWRVVGFTFLALYAFNVLPGVFAIPAGVGDVAIGIAALFMVRRIDRDPSYVLSNGFARFNLLGLADFAVAIVTSGVASGAFPALIAGGVTSAPMDLWPLNIFPSFIVPIFIILHLTVLLKVRVMRRTEVAFDVENSEVSQ
jgi:hypothetical protein